MFFVCHIERTPWSGSLNRTQHALLPFFCAPQAISATDKSVWQMGGACVHGELQRCCGRVLQGNIFLNIGSHKRLSTGRGPGWGSGGGVSNEEFRSSGGHSKQLPRCWGSIQPTKNWSGLAGGFVLERSRTSVPAEMSARIGPSTQMPMVLESLPGFWTGAVVASRASRRASLRMRLQGSGSRG